MAKKAETALFEIKPIEMVDIPLRIVGDSPLIVHAWSEKAKRMILDAEQGKKAGTKKEPKNPTEDFIRSLYWLTPMPADFTLDGFNAAVEAGARFGFPITAFKQAAISAAYRMGWVKDKMGLRGAFFLDGTAGDSGDMVEITGSVPTIREDMVRVGMGVADIRYRGMFETWAADITMRYVAPLAGSVDRNSTGWGWATSSGWSLPSRGAWIEMMWTATPSSLKPVAPLAGSVDRNRSRASSTWSSTGRSPRGERG